MDTFNRAVDSLLSQITLTNIFRLTRDRNPTSTIIKLGRQSADCACCREYIDTQIRTTSPLSCSPSWEPLGSMPMVPRCTSVPIYKFDIEIIWSRGVEGREPPSGPQWWMVLSPHSSSLSTPNPFFPRPSLDFPNSTYLSRSIRFQLYCRKWQVTSVRASRVKYFASSFHQEKV